MDVWGTLKEVVAKGAPILANAIVPGSGGIASTLIGNVLGIDPNDPEKMISELKKANPEVWVKLKEVQMQHEAKLIELGIENDKMYLDDIKNAREREIEIAKSGGSNTPMYILASLIVVGFFILMCILIFKTTAIPEGTKEIAYILVGTLSANFGQVCQYFFGSSKGSNDKNKFLSSNMSFKK